MADITKQSTELKIEYLFVDEDTRLQKIKNPRDDIAKEDIAELNAWLQANNIVVGDKNGATFARIKSATRATITKTTLDLKL